MSPLTCEVKVVLNMKKIFSLLLVAVVFASVLGQVMAVPSYHQESQPAQQSSSIPQNYLKGCLLLNRTDPIRDYYGNVTQCHVDRHPHLEPHPVPEDQD